MADQYDRLTEAAPIIVATINARVEGDWRILPTPPDADPVTARSVLLGDRRGLTIRLHIDDYVQPDGKLIADGQLPALPDDVRASETHTDSITTGHIGMTTKKLDQPRLIVNQINSRLLPVLDEAYEVWQDKVAAARAKEANRQRAADVLADVPGLSEPRRNDFAHTRTNALLLSWDGTDRHTGPRDHLRTCVPKIRVTVDATPDLDTVHLDLSNLSAEAARAAVAAAIAASRTPLEP